MDENDPIRERVRKTYDAMHTHQTVDFVKGMTRPLYRPTSFACNATLNTVYE